MKKFSNEDIRKFGPCYDPKYFKDEDSYNALDIIDHADIPFEDKLWVLMRTDFVSEKTMRLFAVWSYRQTLEFIKDPDPRCIEAANVSERFANGEATSDELSAACSAAWSAAWSAESAAWSAESAACSAARSAACSAAWSAESAARSAESAAESAARSAACSAACSAAWSAESAESAACSAAWSAACSAARSAACSAACSAAWSSQQQRLRQMIVDGELTGNTY
jgi:hypothetical protein